MQSPGTVSEPFPLGEREFVFLMAMMQAINALAFDAMLPALGEIANDLGVVEANRRQLVLGVYLISGGIGSLFPGVLADRFGRRPVLMFSLSAYFLLAVACALATNFEVLIGLRAIQGLCGSGLYVIPLAVIRDRFSGDRMARAQSLVAMVFVLVPMLAPTLGQLVLLVADWRWVFLIMAILSGATLGWMWLRLPETLSPEYRQEVRPRVIAANMISAIFNRATAGYVFGSALIQGSMFGFLNVSQQLLAIGYGLGRLFPFAFGGLVAVMIAANFTNSRIVERFGTRRVSHFALTAYIIVAFVMFAFTVNGLLVLGLFAATMAAMIFLTGLTNTNFQATALTPFAHIAGAAASIQASVRMVTAASLGVLIGQAFDGTALSLTVGMLLGGTGALLLILYAERGRLFQRKVAPDEAMHGIGKE